jgi:hypothetical protein
MLCLKLRHSGLSGTDFDFCMVHRASDSRVKFLEVQIRRIAKVQTGIRPLFDTLRQLMTTPEPTKRRMEFIVKERGSPVGKSIVGSHFDVSGTLETWKFPRGFLEPPSVAVPAIVADLRN